MVVVVENEVCVCEIIDYCQCQICEKVFVVVFGVCGLFEQMMNWLQEIGRKEFLLVLKVDVQGFVEVVVYVLVEFGNDEVGVCILLLGVGGIIESDIMLVVVFKVLIFGFNVCVNKQVCEVVFWDGIEICYYNVIYDLVDDIKVVMFGLLFLECCEIFFGNVEIKEIFYIFKVGKVVGCLVIEGVVECGVQVCFICDDVVIYEGELGMFKCFKDEVKFVEFGQECGVNFICYQDMCLGDVIECFCVEYIKCMF